MGRTLEQAWAKPEWEVLCVIGYENGAQQIARLEHRGRSVWKSRRAAEKHASDYQKAHGRVAYASAC